MQKDFARKHVNLVSFYLFISIYSFDCQPKFPSIPVSRSSFQPFLYFPSSPFPFTLVILILTNHVIYIYDQLWLLALWSYNLVYVEVQKVCLKISKSTVYVFKKYRVHTCSPCVAHLVAKRCLPHRLSQI